MAIFLSWLSYSSTSFLTWFMYLALMSEPTKGILCDFTIKFVLFYNHAYEVWMLAMNEPSCLLLDNHLNLCFLQLLLFPCFLCQFRRCPLCCIDHSCMEVIVIWIALKTLVLYFNFYCMSCKLTTTYAQWQDPHKVSTWSPPNGYTSPSIDALSSFRYTSAKATFQIST